ncbi:MAG: DNA-binding response OmpR family regulator [Acidimicrobiales bacterium]|jgi:DNA-binding response OmpR family regulator
MQETFLLFPDPAPADVVRSLDMAGYQWVASSGLEAPGSIEPEGGWTGAIIAVDEDADRGWALCRELRRQDVPLEPLLLLASGNQLDQLDDRAELFDDFVIAPFHPREFDARLKHLLWRAGRGVRPELVEYGPLELNIETYQAQVDGRPLDLTYMEYELLKHLAANPGRVFTREILLSQVWGYEYYGGARTVDVHIRRLRAKLGEEHANLIQTVRSVGYKLGQSRW